MTERHQDVLEYFISPVAPGVAAGAVTSTGDGSVDRPFTSIEALAQATNGSTIGDAGHGPQRLEIICIDRPGSRVDGIKKPKHRFFVDANCTSNDSDGSEASPWPDFHEAMQSLVELEKDGALSLKPGDHVAVSEHEIFTPTAHQRGKRRKEQIAKYAFMMMSLMLIAPVLAILSYLTIKAWPALSMDFLLLNPTEDLAGGGIWAPLVGTFFLVLVSLLLAAPVGVLAGVYLNEYARDNWFTRIISLAVVNLAGVPSIVHALFGVGAFVMFAHMGECMLAASCTLAVMTLPVIITSTREALAAVPMAFREACWNMGASRWQTIRTIVLPNSISGILTGVILQVSRAAGETAPILFTGAAVYKSVPNSGVESLVPYGLFDECMALSYHLYAVRTQFKVPESIEYGTAVVLIGLVLVVNSASISLRVYLRSRKKW